MTTSRIDAERLVAALYSGILRRAADASEIAELSDALMKGKPACEIAEQFLSSAEFNSKAGTKLFVPPGHYYSPIVDVAEARRHLDRIAGAPSTELPGIKLVRTEMAAFWRELLPFLQDIPFAEEPRPPFRYGFSNPSYSWGDGSVLHAMLRKFRPRRLIEIGSGWSSACTLDTVEKYLDGNCDLTFIEPFPHLLHDLIGTQSERVRIITSPVQDVPLDVFDPLEAGDILFIDSTHVMRTGSDVCYEILEILPRLKKGVVVHIHDMFWPFEYPRDWSLDENRSWNELYAVRAFLCQNDGWRILMFNNYLAHMEPELIEATYPAFMRNSGGALWLQRV